ncbi:MAG: hypothetical protein AAGB22_16075, partial [Bacteroidota bacterium]
TKTFHAFNHSNPGSNDPEHWRKAEEVTLLDEYSSPLEIEDINGNHRAVKKGYNEELVIAEALDARYTEFYFCGAEDPNVFSGYFGGEVNGSAYAYKSEVYAHTGQRSLRMAAGDVLPLAREVTFGTSGAEDMAEQTYVASVWVHQENKDNVSLYYKLSNGGGSGPQAWQSITSNSIKAGDWYLLTLEVPLANPAFNPYNIVEVGLEISSSCGSCYVYCDDFRLQPQGSTMTAYVYEPETRRRVAMLNNDNFGTKYVYDPLGRLIRESREQADQPSLLGGFKKVQENTYHNHTQ